jgi:hypothetical protein
MIKLNQEFELTQILAVCFSAAAFAVCIASRSECWQCQRRQPDGMAPEKTQAAEGTGYSPACRLIRSRDYRFQCLWKVLFPRPKYARLDRRECLWLVQDNERLTRICMMNF